MPTNGHKNVSRHSVRQGNPSRLPFGAGCELAGECTNDWVGARVPPELPGGQKSPQRFATGTAERAGWLGSVIADGLDRAAFFGFLAAGFFFGRLRLLAEEGVTTVLVTLEIVGRGLAAQGAIDALVIDVILARNVFRILVCSVSHRICYFGPAIWPPPPPMASPFSGFCSRLPQP